MEEQIQEHVMKKLRFMQKSRILCDLELISCDGKSVYVHSLIWMAAFEDTKTLESPFFIKASQRLSKLDLPTVEANILEDVVRFIYGEYISVFPDGFVTALEKLGLKDSFRFLPVYPKSRIYLQNENSYEKETFRRTYTSENNDSNLSNWHFDKQNNYKIRSDCINSQTNAVTVEYDTDCQSDLDLSVVKEEPPSPTRSLNQTTDEEFNYSSNRGEEEFPYNESDFREEETFMTAKCEPGDNAPRMSTPIKNEQIQETLPPVVPKLDQCKILDLYKNTTTSAVTSDLLQVSRKTNQLPVTQNKNVVILPKLPEKEVQTVTLAAFQLRQTNKGWELESVAKTNPKISDCIQNTNKNASSTLEQYLHDQNIPAPQESSPRTSTETCKTVVGSNKPKSHQTNISTCIDENKPNHPKNEDNIFGKKTMNVTKESCLKLEVDNDVSDHKNETDESLHLYYETDSDIDNENDVMSESPMSHEKLSTLKSPKGKPTKTAQEMTKTNEWVDHQTSKVNEKQSSENIFQKAFMRIYDGDKYEVHTPGTPSTSQNCQTSSAFVKTSTSITQSLTNSSIHKHVKLVNTCRNNNIQVVGQTVMAQATPAAVPRPMLMQNLFLQPSSNHTQVLKYTCLQTPVLNVQQPQHLVSLNGAPIIQPSHVPNVQLIGHASPRLIRPELQNIPVPYTVQRMPIVSFPTNLTPQNVTNSAQPIVIPISKQLALATAASNVHVSHAPTPLSVVSTSGMCLASSTNKTLPLDEKGLQSNSQVISSQQSESITHPSNKNVVSNEVSCQKTQNNTDDDRMQSLILQCKLATNREIRPRPPGMLATDLCSKPSKPKQGKGKYREIKPKASMANCFFQFNGALKNTFQFQNQSVSDSVNEMEGHTMSNKELHVDSENTTCTLKRKYVEIEKDSPNDEVNEKDCLAPRPKAIKTLKEPRTLINEPIDKIISEKCKIKQNPNHRNVNALNKIKMLSSISTLRRSNTKKRLLNRTKKALVLNESHDTDMQEVAQVNQDNEHDSSSNQSFSDLSLNQNSTLEMVACHDAGRTFEDKPQEIPCTTVLKSSNRLWYKIPVTDIDNNDTADETT